jgi:non-homologous end joining protein Ku
LAKAQSYVSEFNISLFPISLVGKLVTVKRTGAAQETALTNICPKCEVPTKPEQFYICPNHTDKYKSGELAKAKKVGKDLVRVDPKQAKAAKSSLLPLDLLELTIHPAEEVESQTYRSANAYLFVPNVQSKQYGVLVDIIKDSQYAFIGQVNIKHNEYLVRLLTWQGFLIVQQLLYPEDVNEVETPVYEHSQEFVDTMLEFVQKNVVEFSAENYKNQAKVRFAEFIKATENGEEVPVIESKKVDSDDVALENLKKLLAS